MKNPIKKIFWTLVIIFIIIVGYFAIDFELKRVLFPYLAGLGLIFLILGGLLIYYTKKAKIKGKLKWYLILTGGAPIVAFISVILHNLVYGLMIYFFGEEVWGAGGDEAFFFILAFIVCPIAFLVGIIRSIILMQKKK